MTERVIVTKRRIYRLAPEQEGVPVETYLPGAILPEILKGAKVYQTGRADYGRQEKAGKKSLNNFIILFS